VTAWLVRVNSTSLHRYYRAQLSRVYLDYDRDRAEEDAGSRQLSHLDTVARGGPYHLIGAALNVLTIKEVLMHVFGGSKDQGADDTEAFEHLDTDDRGGGRGSIKQGGQVPDPHVEIVDAKRYRRMGDDACHPQYSWSPKERLQHPSGNTEQYKRRADDGEHHMLKHMGGKQILHAQDVEWREQCQRQKPHTGNKEGYFAPVYGLRKMIAPTQRPQSIEVRSGHGRQR